MIVMPLGPGLMRIFAIEPKELGLLVSSYNFAAGIAGFLAAFFLDRFDRKRALVFCYTGFTIGTLACAISQNYLSLLTSRTVAGAFGGVVTALIFSIIGDAFQPNKRGRATGLVMSAFSIASIFGVPFGLILANKFDWHAPFVVIGGLALLIGGAVAVQLPAMRDHLQSKESRPSPFHVIERVVKNPMQLRALLLITTLMLGQFAIVPFLAPSLVANAGFREDQLPWMYLLGGGLTMFTSPLIGRMCDKIGRNPVFVVFGLLFLVPAIIITQLEPMPVIWVLIFTSIFFVANNGRFVPAWAMITSTVRPEARGSFLSLATCMQSLSAGAASFVASFIVVGGQNGRLMNFDLIGYVSAAIGLMAVIIGSRLKAIDSQ